MKYLVVTGGVVSGLGKGITISSLGVLLKSAGLRVTSIKIDPYLVRALTDTQLPTAKPGLLPPTPPPRPHPARARLQNSDAGTMSPFEHGEVFVLNDGGEVRARRQCRLPPGRGGHVVAGWRTTGAGAVRPEARRRPPASAPGWPARSSSSAPLVTSPPPPPPHRPTWTLATTSASWA